MGHYKVGEFNAAQREGEVARLAEQARAIAVMERAALRDVGLPRSGVGIEVGCGPGFFAQGLTQALREELARGSDRSVDLSLVGVDYDGFVLREARSRLPVVRGDANALPFAPASFDFAYSRLFLRHVSDVDGVQAGISALVRPGGVVAAIDSSDSSLLLDPMPAGFAAIAAARRHWFDSRGGRADMGHMLPGVFVRAGLHDVRIRTIVIDTSTLPRAAFSQIVLAAFFQAAESTLGDPARLADASAAVADWVNDAAAYGTITLFVVGGRR
jgi:hypothetical protein